MQPLVSYIISLTNLRIKTFPRRHFWNHHNKTNWEKWVISQTHVKLFIILFLKGRYIGAHFLHWNQNSKLWVTWPRIAQSVYCLRDMRLFFNFWMIKFTIMFFFLHSHMKFLIYMSKNHNSFTKYTNWAKLSHFWGKCVFWHVEDLSCEISCMNVKEKT